MQKKYVSKKWTAFLLSLILVVGSFPINAVALESDTSVDSTNQVGICYNNQCLVGYYNISDARKHFRAAPTAYEVLFCLCKSITF